MTSTSATTPDSSESISGGVPLWRRLLISNVLWIFLILVGIVVAFTSMNQNFVQSFNIRSIFADNSSLIVLAIGETFVIITAGIDLSIGSVLIFSGVIAGKTMLVLGSSNPEIAAANEGWGLVLLGVAAGIAAGVGFGIVNGFLVAKAKVPPLIVTLGTYGIALGSSYLLTNGTDLRGMPNNFIETIGFGNLFGQIPYQVIIAAVIALGCGLLLAFTRFGRYTYAVGSNQEAARRVGINVDGHLIKIYALMGGLAGAAGCMSLAHFTTTTISGHTTDNLSAIAAVVIGGSSLFGGRGTVAGTIIGVLIPATLASGFIIIGVNPYYQYVAVGIVLIGAVYLDQLRRRTLENS
ncbi:MAG: ABC transporter permease [Gaiellaceae bacterium]